MFISRTHRMPERSNANASDFQLVPSLDRSLVVDLSFVFQRQYAHGLI
jgi:hypothetical protein